MADKKPVVFVVDDDAAVLESLALLLRSVGLSPQTCGSAAEFLETFDPDAPGCLVLDVRMPGMSGLELQARLQARGSKLPIIFITAHGDVPMAVKAVKAGALDFLQKPFRDQELIEKIQRALEVNARLRTEAADRDEILARLSSLTPREREVMEGVVAGKANKVIAHELGLSQRTVEIHRARVMAKMQASSLAELVQIAMRAEAKS